MEWFMDNLGTIIVAAVVLTVLTLVSIRMARNKKQGKSSCGCGCGGCAMKDQCHPEKKK